MLDDPLSRIVAQGIGVEPRDVDPDREFTDLGIDSIAGLRIMQAVQLEYGDHIPMLTIVEHSTLRRFVGHLRETYLDGRAVPPAPPRQPPAPPDPARVVPIAPGTGTPMYFLPGRPGS
ncbi:hypothetical protein Pflav_012980 [Phytohabitans flavus]|uniref:Carrier domain-containing protein n=1 Tax=Phytohabitans flavus TaxID=1076124 RepID=A0A6F8XM68_9ACTN|nr:acyl carrier protein [Phytohabitans flavus]BCB74888.1 hypothetical protein Pflav_012980 [Phytohabitans flavus]